MTQKELTEQLKLHVDKNNKRVYMGLENKDFPCRRIDIVRGENWTAKSPRYNMLYYLGGNGIEGGTLRLARYDLDRRLVLSRFKEWRDADGWIF